MAHIAEWMPVKRKDKLDMAKVWQNALVTKAAAWGVSDEEVTRLDQAIAGVDGAEAAFLAVPTPANRALLRAAFASLVKVMRFIRGHYFMEPALRTKDFVRLTLKPPKKTRTRKPRPSGWVAAIVEPTGPHRLTLFVRLAPDAPDDVDGANWGVRAYYGVLPHGGASLEAATGIKRELLQEPENSDELPHSVFFRTRKYVFDFSEEDSGKRVFFGCRYENARGEWGPWGTIVSAIIP